jgi:hypothetical protein
MCCVIDKNRLIVEGLSWGKRDIQKAIFADFYSVGSEWQFFAQENADVYAWLATVVSEKE